MHFLSPARKFEGITMLYVDAAVAAFLFIYLFAALIRPEWF
jgi:K+-transporting ATPase KdpF subunit